MQLYGIFAYVIVAINGSYTVMGEHELDQQSFRSIDCSQQDQKQQSYTNIQQQKVRLWIVSNGR